MITLFAFCWYKLLLSTCQLPYRNSCRIWAIWFFKVNNLSSQDLSSINIFHRPIVSEQSGFNCHLKIDTDNLNLQRTWRNGRLNKNSSQLIFCIETRVNKLREIILTRKQNSRFTRHSQLFLIPWNCTQATASGECRGGIPILRCTTYLVSYTHTLNRAQYKNLDRGTTPLS